MAQIKSFTDIEQSTKLAEILPIESADMYWWYSGRRYYIEAMNDGDFNENIDIRAWSLAALIKLLPKGFLLMDDQGESGLYSVWVPGFNSPHIWKDNSLDAVFEMIVWLKENGKL